jgi:hypothetical protein
MKYGVVAAILTCLHLCTASNAIAGVYDFNVGRASASLEHSRIDKKIVSQCVNDRLGGNVCISPRIAESSFGYSICHNGLRVVEEFGEGPITIYKTTFHGMYLVHSASIGRLYGGVYYLLYINHDNKMLLKELFRYLYGTNDQELKFIKTGDALTVHFIEDHKIVLTVEFDGKSDVVVKGVAHPTPTTIILSPSDFIDLSKGMKHDVNVAAFFDNAITHGDKEAGTIFAGETWKGILASVFDNKIPYQVKKLFEIAQEAIVKKQGNYLIIHSPSGNYRKYPNYTNPPLRENWIVTIHKVSGIIEIAWLDMKKEEMSDKERVTVYYASNSNGFCLSHPLHVWADQMRTDYGP